MRGTSSIEHRTSHMLGFSLLEVMVVLVIIGLVAGIITVNVRGRMMLAKQNVAKAEIAAIVDAVEQFQLLYSRYPTNDEGLEILTQPTDRMPEPLLSGSAPVDPWNNPYAYNSPGLDEPFEVISYGADGQEGGEGADRDIVSWDLKGQGDDDF